MESTTRKAGRQPTRAALERMVADLQAEVEALRSAAGAEQDLAMELEREVEALTERARKAENLLALAEMEKLAEPRTATPPAEGHGALSLKPEREGVLRVWLADSKEAYKLTLVHLSTDGAGWQVAKMSDGTAYHLHESDGDNLRCDCPGCTAHGPRCNGGRGCLHMRALRAARRVLDPGL